MTDEQTESFLVLKYGSLQRAFNLWANWKMAMTADQTEYDMINSFFALMPLRERCELTRKREQIAVRLNNDRR